MTNEKPLRLCFSTTSLETATFSQADLRTFSCDIEVGSNHSIDIDSIRTRGDGVMGGKPPFDS